MRESVPLRSTPCPGRTLGDRDGAACPRAIAALLLASAVAACAPNWRQITASGTLPPSRWQHRAVYHAAGNRMVVFGGKTPTTPYAADVWVLRNANGIGAAPTWVAVSPSGPGPVGRHMHSAVFDPTNDRMIVFGGHVSPGPFSADVWVLASAAGAAAGTPQWIPLSPTGTSPSAREWHSAVYDAANNRMIVFGGLSLGGGQQNDVWVLSNANGLGGTPAWTRLTPSGTPPTARVGHTAVYDPASNRMTVFGGGRGFSGFQNDVWVLSNANGLGGTPTWIAVSPTGAAPAPRQDHTAILDGQNQMVVFGGWAGGAQYYNDVWVLRHANGLGGTPAWSRVTPRGGPPRERELATAVYDSVNHRMVVFAGSFSSPVGLPAHLVCDSGSCLNDLWILER